MSERNRRIFSTCLILACINCLCLCLIGGGGVAIWKVFPKSSPDAATTQPISSTEIKITSTPIEFVEQTPSPTNSSNSEISPFVAAQMDQIEQDVIELRGLSPEYPVKRTLLTSEQLRQRVIEDFLEDYTEENAYQDSIVLAAFGLLEPGFDLIELYIELLSEQVAGFYDNETKEIYVVKGDAFEGIERMTYSHEYTHALQDQVYDIKNGLKYDEDICKDDSERCAAIQALLEGDATLSELSWFQAYSTEEDQQQVLEFYSSYESPVLDNAPEFLKQDLLFPYENGLLFVQALYDEGGWKAVDNAFLNPPVSTEQILHPEKYPNDHPLEIPLPDLELDNGWEEFERGVMGEWYTYLIFRCGREPNARLETEQAENAAEGWDGDSYVVYYNDAEETTIMILSYLWESPKDTEEFVEAFETYANIRFGGLILEQENWMAWQSTDGYHELHFDSREVTWILAPDAETADTIWKSLQP